MFLSSVDFFSKSTFSKNYFRNTIRVSNSADQGQARRSVQPDLGPNCLQRLSADGTKRQIANYQLSSKFWCNDCSSFNSRDVFLFWVFCYLPPTGLDKNVNLFFFSYFSTKAYVVGTHWDNSNEYHNKCFCWNIRKIEQFCVKMFICDCSLQFPRLLKEVGWSNVKRSNKDFIRPNQIVRNCFLPPLLCDWILPSDQDIYCFVSRLVKCNLFRTSPVC